MLEGISGPWWRREDAFQGSAIYTQRVTLLPTRSRVFDLCPSHQTLRFETQPIWSCRILTLGGALERRKPSMLHYYLLTSELELYLKHLASAPALFPAFTFKGVLPGSKLQSGLTPDCLITPKNGSMGQNRSETNGLGPSLLVSSTSVLCNHEHYL